MQRETEIELLDEILGLRKQKSAFLDKEVAYSPVDRYTDPARFAMERDKLFFGLPSMLAHTSELPEEGSFLCRDHSGIPVLLTRDRDGKVHAFYNVCRHRGARLVEAESGCRHRFSCPYHAWTYDNQGRLIGVPHQAQGFPDLDKAAFGLKPIACTEAHGWIFVQIGNPDGADAAVGDYLDPIAEDFAWLNFENLQVFATDSRDWACNWKVLIEGGLEAYHFRVAHAATIGSLFHDNLSTYRLFGTHIRSVLARTTIDELVEKPRREWNIREHANLLYTVFPTSALLVQHDHVAWIHFVPLGPDRTRIRCVTLIPKPAEPLSEKAEGYWRKNHELTVRTLREDFELGEKIQAGFLLGVNDTLAFGRFEGALDRFNGVVDEACAPA